MHPLSVRSPRNDALPILQKFHWFLFGDDVVEKLKFLRAGNDDPRTFHAVPKSKVFKSQKATYVTN